MAGQLKCSKCQNDLSVAPILTLDNDETICGRCETFQYEKSSNPKRNRQFVYEKLAKQMEFSCRYEKEGCEATLMWDNVKEHEKQCDFGKIACILSKRKFGEYEECDWKGESSDHFWHVSESHATKMGKIHKLRIWDDPKNRLIMINYYTDLLLVFLLFENDSYYITLVSEKKEPIKCKIEIMDESGENLVVLTRLPTILPSNFEKVRELGLKLNTNIPDPKFLSIYFLDKIKCVENFRDKLFPRCHSCNEKLKLPVFCCESLHLYCKRCYENVCGEECQIEHSRSLRLSHKIKPAFSKLPLIDTFSSTNYKCENVGCFFLGNYYELENHVEFCKFRPCLISKLNHLYDFPDATESFFFVFDNSTFKLLLTDFANTCTFRLFSLKSTQTKYKLEITVFYSTLSTMSFSIFSKFELAKDCYSDNSVEIPKSLLYRAGSESFKFNISIIPDNEYES